MRWGAVAFLLGALLPAGLPVLPAPGATAALLLLPLIALHARIPAALAMAMLGFLWAVLRAHLVLDDALPAVLEAEPVVIEGRIASIPERNPLRQRFEFDVDHLSGLKREWDFRGRIRISWYRTPELLSVGDRWRFSVKLERPHGLANPGGFDYEAWLFLRRIRATGYVVSSGYNQLLARADGEHLDRFRAELTSGITQRLPGRDAAHLLAGLTIGIHYGIDDRQWSVLRRSGTLHLFIISGLHISVIAGLSFLLARWLWALPAVTVLWIPAPRFAAAVALGSAAAYSALAGFSIPTQRALIMVAAALLDRLAARPIAIGDRVAIALVGVLLVDPFAVLAPGFWLSFGAVASILYVTFGRVRGVGGVRALLLVNTTTAVALTPLLFHLLGSGSVVAPAANLFCVPYVNLIVLPIGLIGVLLLALYPDAADVPLALAAGALELIWPLLEAFAAPRFAALALPSGSLWNAAAAMVGIALLLAPAGVPGRWLGPIWFLPLLLAQAPPPAEGEFELIALDVAQGLAAVITTRRHCVLFDTGPRFGPDNDAGAAAIVPFLRHAGIDRLDAVILSHGDSDHTGGWNSVRAEIEVRDIIASEATRVIEPRARACRKGLSWEWDGVRFEFLHPGAGSHWSGNDGSCVLRVRGRHGAALIPGDIERPAEASILADSQDHLAAALLIAPHHGSRSSSTPGWVRAVRPQVVIIPAARRNRFGFPHPEVAAAYRRAGARVLTTGESGAITVAFRSASVEVSGFRERVPRFWR
jgi:competence protein ComEC